LENEKIIIQTKQSLGFDILSILFVLLLPLIMIFFSNNNGIFVGIIFLIYIVYGIVFLYNKLYRKKLVIKTTNISFEDKYYLKKNIQNIDYDEIKEILVEQELFNKLLNLGKLTIVLNDKQEISLKNIENPYSIKDSIENIKLK